jgi:hypothetical protein
MCIGYLWESQKERNRYENQNLGWWMDLGEIGWDGMVWINLAQDRDYWRVLVNAVMNPRVHKMLGSTRVPAQLVASRVVLSSIKLISYVGS